MANFLSLVFQLLWWAILIRVLLSWLPMANIRIDPYHPAIRVIYSITDPILEPLREYLTISMIDFSPVFVLILLGLIQDMLLKLLS